jgi:CIC family chloride channel protein
MSGIIVYKFAPEAEGHGTDAYISAFHNKKGYIRGRVPIIKVISAAIMIGSGGSGGSEGPINLVGAGLGSWISRKLNLSEKDIRIALICGAAGGLGAIFKAPFGSAIFAFEVLYKRDYESDALLPAFISSTIAYSIFGLFFGFEPIFQTPNLVFNVYHLPFYALLGFLCAGISILYVTIFYGMQEKIFNKIAVPPYIKPAIGGFFVGLIAIYIPAVMGVGYGWIQLAIYGKIALTIMISIVFAKIIATSFSISSGGSGGVFAPSLVIGAFIGGSLGAILIILYPESNIPIAAFVIVGMAAFITGAGNVIIAPIIIVLEITGTHALLVPSMLACSISYILTIKWTIFRSQIDTKEDSPVHQAKFENNIKREEN